MMPSDRPTDTEARAPWEEQIARSVTDAARLGRYFDLDAAARRAAEVYPVRLTPYLLDLACRSEGVARQFVPDGAELDGADASPDPLHEEQARPVPSVIHRYPDRLLLMAGTSCAANCRFCTRKGRVGLRGDLAEGIEYIRCRRTVRHVILSGGDPLLLDDAALAGLLDELRAIDHVRVLRIHTRVPSVLPMRVTAELARLLGRRQPLYMIVHFNHPDELTAAAHEALRLAADSGVPLGNQGVLLRGVNDEPRVMQSLMEKLLEERVRPYYLHHPDGTRGTRHFDSDPARGLAIIDHLRRTCCGLAVPHYVRDEPGCAWKKPVVSACQRPDKS